MPARSILPTCRPFLRKRLIVVRFALKGGVLSSLVRRHLWLISRQLMSRVQKRRLPHRHSLVEKRKPSPQVVVFEQSPLSLKKSLPNANMSWSVAKNQKDQTATQVKHVPKSQAKQEGQASLPVKPVLPEKESLDKGKNRWLQRFFLCIFGCSLLALILLFGPALYYRFVPTDAALILPTASLVSQDKPTYEQATPSARMVALPAYDPTLPTGTWLVIPRIGVRTEIQDTVDPEVALEKGAWRAPDFGVPGDISKPMIVAAHRYGYVWWWKQGSLYWKYHSFYLLPKLETGDVVEVIADQRKYLYTIYAGEEGSEITDYSADLILYTCKFLTGDTRFFRYARLAEAAL